MISHAAQIPRDMVFRDVGDRFGTSRALGRRVVGQNRRSRRWRTGWC